MCFAFKPCEAPHKCVDSKECQPPGVQVAYSCTYPGVCCDKSGGSAADAGGSTDAGTEADAGSSADTK